MVRGDYALIFYTVALGALYTAARSFFEDPAWKATAIAGTYFSTLASVTVAYRLSPWHPLAEYPGPLLWRVTSMFLTFVSLKGKRHFVLDNLHKKYGPFLRIGPNTLSLNTPSATSIYLTMEKSEAYRFPAHDDIVGIFFKQESKELHRDRKKIWQGMFTPNGMGQLFPALERRTWQLFECLERRQKEGGGYLNIGDAFYHWSHDFMGDMVFSGCNEFELMKNGDPQELIYNGKLAIVAMDSFGQSPWLMDILWHAPATRDMHILVRRAAEMTQKRVKTKDLPAFRDLMSYLIDGGVRLRDLERDAVIAILGGSDNTSLALALSCYFLASEPQYVPRLRAELSKAFPDPLQPISLDALTPEALPLLNGVVQEALRLGSPYFLPRVVPPGGTRVDGTYIPEDTIVALAAYSQQTSEENFYPEPMEFRPERWTPGGLGPDTRTNKAVLASFSFGAHSCIGKALAYHEMRYVLARLVLAYDLEFKPGFDVASFRGGMMNMRTTLLEHDLWMRVVRRPGVDLEGRVFAKME
ncbi:cytochrome P450 [Earliella scabrosa]|nr:cytochrome P450 [Earliella scabrosa]